MVTTEGNIYGSVPTGGTWETGEVEGAGDGATLISIHPARVQRSGGVRGERTARLSFWRALLYTEGNRLLVLFQVREQTDRKGRYDQEVPLDNLKLTLTLTGPRPRVSDAPWRIAPKPLQIQPCPKRVGPLNGWTWWAKAKVSGDGI